MKLEPPKGQGTFQMHPSPPPRGLLPGLQKGQSVKMVKREEYYMVVLAEVPDLGWKKGGTCGHLYLCPEKRSKGSWSPFL